MKLFNTLTQSLQEFKPANDTVTIYVCGVTPYDTTHLGHAFTYITFDTLIRYLEYKGHSVKYVQNVTDIDDDVLRKSRELGMKWDELGNREIERFLGEMDSLNWRRPDVYARATDEIERIIQVNQGLIERGLAYVSEGCVFYEVKKDAEFGKLAQAVGLNDYQSMLTIANERGNFPDDKRKRDPLDFVLWQAQAPGEPAWESPWGPGRPGWHIECSSMSMHYLGQQVDIHGGGADLVFPHHTCEIAQSEHYSGKAPFVRNWMHVGMVYQEGEKMSKSLGNLTLVRNLLKEYSANAIRLVLQSHHYRYQWECFPEELKIAAETDKLFTRVREMVGPEEHGEDSMLHNRFIAAMENDLNTPEATLLLKHAAQQALEENNSNLGSEVLRLAKVLGLTV
ncbi:cysteine--tRNA ligase [Dictyobacter alpinus]|uniref:Cysteine--tRNA ligase n=1 Tax=Dictyobacter alpinus TaxID=2014873 RepID=A0A402B5Q6_9CHLR|nr:cysteine--tRNA ligase [Dictyobacter alpinus]GCE26691.1 cysteine--tRNA ligase [Dictyobacter alpinus]